MLRRRRNDSENIGVVATVSALAFTGLNRSCPRTQARQTTGARSAHRNRIASHHLATFPADADFEALDEALCRFAVEYLRQAELETSACRLYGHRRSSIRATLQVVWHMTRFAGSLLFFLET
jgi:hypothetical protein